MGRTRTHLRRSYSSGPVRYARWVFRNTDIVRFTLLLIALWIVFATGLYLAERTAPEPVIRSFGAALYWGIAAFSTAGIADMPQHGLSQVIGGLWIVVGSVIFFGIIVATITGYFMRPMQKPVRRIVDLIEYNLEHLSELTVEELDLLRETTDSLILHVERLKSRSEPQADSASSAASSDSS